MTYKERDLARQFARAIIEHERRNDYGGTYQQCRVDLTEQIFVWGEDGRPNYLLPDGTRTRVFLEAIGAWSADGVNT